MSTSSLSLFGPELNAIKARFANDPEVYEYLSGLQSYIASLGKKAAALQAQSGVVGGVGSSGLGQSFATVLAENLPNSRVLVGGCGIVLIDHGAGGSLIITRVGGPPGITSLNPSSICAGSAEFNLLITGTNFLPTSIVEWNGSALTTFYVGPTQLLATVPAANVASAGTANIKVLNPSTGCQSAAAGFPINPCVGFNVVALMTQDPTSWLTSGQCSTGNQWLYLIFVTWFGGYNKPITITFPDWTTFFPAGGIAGNNTVTGNNNSPPGGTTLNPPSPGVFGLSVRAGQLTPGIAPPVTFTPTVLGTSTDGSTATCALPLPFPLFSAGSAHYEQYGGYEICGSASSGCSGGVPDWQCTNTFPFPGAAANTISYSILEGDLVEPFLNPVTMLLITDSTPSGGSSLSCPQSGGPVGSVAGVTNAVVTATGIAGTYAFHFKFTSSDGASYNSGQFQVLFTAPL